MIYPNNLVKGDTIGLTATSDGFSKDMDIQRFAMAKDKLIELGFHVEATDNLLVSDHGKSGTGKERASQFMQLINDSKVKSIVLAKGGDYLCQMLPYIDFEQIKKHAKWVQGYSDSTGILFTITTKCDVATLYSNHFNDFAMNPWHNSIENNMNILKGKPVIQHSFSYYENHFVDRVTPGEPYSLDTPVCWESASKKPEHLEGRLLGGCLDVIMDLIGTPYDEVNSYVERHKEEGIIWVLESFALNDSDMIRKLWQMRQAGWFEHTRGFVFGRPCFFTNTTGYSYMESVMESIGDLNVPILFNCDVGHRSPQFTLMLGGYGVWNFDGQGGSLEVIKRYGRYLSEFNGVSRNIF